MEYGLIGKTLKHSFSKEIHESLSDYKYDLFELEERELDSFFSKKDFLAINVTIPYKEKVIKYLDYKSPEVIKTNSCNVIVNKEGRLFGYNSDYVGFVSSIKHFDINVKGKTVLVLGSGGASKTVQSALSSLGAKEVFVSSRNNAGNISYDKIYEIDANVIINATPVGMYPNNYESLVDLKRFKNLTGVFDLVYNPINTKLVMDAKAQGINSCGGLYMLVSQAIYAMEYFGKIKADDKLIDETYERVLKEKQNIALIGMPTSGKTTVGKALAQVLNKNFYDIDSIIEEKENKKIFEIIDNKGESYFRDLETKTIFDISKENSCVISCGGGVVVNDANMQYLKQNSYIVFLNRSLDLLTESSDRPLSRCRSDLERLYQERINLYKKYMDIEIDNNEDVKSAVRKICELVELIEVKK